MSSTWGARSLFGRHPDVIGNLLAELNVDDHIVLAVLHPNTWYAHGPLQIRHWLSDYLRAGLRLVPPVRGWQQAIIAADVVIGDHGAVTGYAAAIGRPTLLAAFPDQDVAPGSAIEALGKSARRLDFRRPLRDQLKAAIDRHDPGDFRTVRELTSSLPDESATALRRICYALIDIAEPNRPALIRPYAPDEFEPQHLPTLAITVSAEPIDDATVRIVRWPADVTAWPGCDPTPADVHQVVADDHPRRDLLTNAAIVVRQGDQPLDEIIASYPACRLAVLADQGIVRHRDGHTARLRVIDGPGEVILGASAIHALLLAGRAWSALPARITVTHGRFRTTIRCQRS
jgi:hypothetical protein